MAPVAYTALAVLLSIVCRSLFMPHWSPVEEPSDVLSFLILWIMSVLPVLYLAFRRWAEESLESFMPQVFVFLVLSFGIQTSLKAVSLAFEVLSLPSAAFMPLVWLLPWLALTTLFKNGYTTRRQCKKLLFVLIPTVLLIHIGYLILPVFALATAGMVGSAATLLGLVVLMHGIFAWRLSKKPNPA